MDKQYRLRDDLGGHPVVVHERLTDLEDREVIDVAIPALGLDWMRVTAAALVEVRPPSIDDPVTLPLKVEDSYRDGLQFTARLDDETLVEVERFNSNGAISSPVYITASQCRLIARALWQRANAIEAVQ